MNTNFLWISTLVFSLTIFSTTGFSQSKGSLHSPSHKEHEDICPIIDTTPDKIGIRNEPEDYVDFNKEVKDIGTDFIVNKFFTSEDTLYNYFQLVYETIDQEVKAYRDAHGLDERAVFFIFKGGNVLRIVANQIFSMVPPNARQLLKDTYAEYFKRSDTDFSIIVDPQKLLNLDYEKTMDELTKLAYNALDKVRNKFIKNPQKYFNYFQLNEITERRELKEPYEKLVKISALSNKDNPNWFNAEIKQLRLLGITAEDKLQCKYHGQYDYLFEFDPKNKDNIIGTPLDKTPHWIANSINKTLEWHVKGAHERIIKFYLVRMKLAYNIIFSKDEELQGKIFSGELVDVSLPHQKDFRLEEFIDNYDKWISDYRLSLKGQNETITFKAESLLGLADDLFNVVLEQFSRPWADAKYEKRINRIFFLAAAEMMGSMGLGSDRAKDYIEEVTMKIIDPLLAIYPLQGGRSNTTIERIVNDAERISEKYQEMGIANKIWRRLGDITKTALIDAPEEKDEENFRALLLNVDKHLDVMWKLSDMEPMIIDLSKIYDAKMSSFF